MAQWSEFRFRLTVSPCCSSSETTSPSATVTAPRRTHELEQNTPIPERVEGARDFGCRLRVSTLGLEDNFFCLFEGLDLDTFGGSGAGSNPSTCTAEDLFSFLFFNVFKKCSCYYSLDFNEPVTSILVYPPHPLFIAHSISVL